MKSSIRAYYQNTFETLIKDKYLVRKAWLHKSESFYYSAVHIYQSLNEANERIKEDCDSNIQTERELLLMTAGLNLTLGLNMGYSLETLIKCSILMKCDVTKHEENGKFKSPWRQNGHSLHYLYKSIEKECLDKNGKLKANEKALMGKLSQYTIWRGKYPHSLKVEDMIPVLFTEESVVYDLNYIEHTDFELFKELFHKIKDTIE